MYHMKAKHMKHQPLLKCEICEYTTTLPHYLKRHFRERHVVAPELACQNCHRKFHNNSQLRGHIKMAHQSKIDRHMPCWLCGDMLNTENKLNFHIGIHHPDEEPKFECSKCPEKFHVEQCIAGHMKLRHSEKNKCTRKGCKLVFKTKDLLTEHIKNDHLTQNVSKIVNLVY